MNMTRRLMLGAICTVFVTALAFAQQGITGTWEGETGSGTAIVLTLKAEKTALTGTLKRGDETSPISEGKVTKNTFTFKATLNGQTETLAGEVNGDEIKAWLERQGPERAIVFRRVKPAK
jgi:hypothetical protein